MNNFKFSIDKEANFAYWLQSLVNWSPSFQKDTSEYYLKRLGVLNDIEKEALKDLKLFLEEKDRGYLWLWSIYAGKKLRDKAVFLRWSKIKEVFSEKFELIWDEQRANLYGWKKLLETKDFSGLAAKINKARKFFGVQKKSAGAYNVRLLVGWDKNFPTGHTHRNFPNSIALSISAVSANEIIRVFCILIHEAIHHLGYASNIFEKELAASYLAEIKPKELKIPGQNWKHLLTETVITSMAGRRLNNYFGKFLARDEKTKRQALTDVVELKNFSFKKNKLNSGFLIRKASSLALPMTSKYLDAGKRIDNRYAKKIASIWLKIAGINR